MSRKICTAISRATRFMLALAVITAPALPASALDVRYDNLNGGKMVSGIDASTATSPVVNRENISMTANGDTTGTYLDTSFTAFGLNSPTVNAVNNSGRIDLTANGGVPSAGGNSAFTAIGIYSGGTVINSSNINLSATGGSGGNFVSMTLATGIQSINSGYVTSNGNISVKATGGSGGMINEAVAIGILSNGGAVTSSGNVNATATGGSGGMINLAEAIGITSTSGAVTSSGNINATATGDSGSMFSLAEAIGIQSVTSGAVTNSGNVNATANTVGSGGMNASAAATGIQTGGVVINSGNINATAILGSGVSGSVATACGISSAGGQVTNSGNINVTASGGSGSPGVTAFGIQSFNGTVTNSGFITASATSGGSIPTTAGGIYFPNGGTLTNTGIIRTTGDNAYEVYAVNGALNLANRYNINLDGNPARGSIFSGGAVNINNALLSATAAGGLFNTEYRIFDGPGTVNGSFGGLVQPLNRAVTLVYHDQGTAGSSDDTVSLIYHPGTSPILEGVNVIRRSIGFSMELVRQQQINAFLEGLLSEGRPVRLAAADHIASDAHHGIVKSSPDNGVFFIPYYADLDKDSDSLGYNANFFGFTTGYEKNFGRNQLGFHVGYGHADIDFSGADFPRYTQEQQDIATFGLHGMGTRGNWTLRGDLTGFYGHHDYSGATGVNLDAIENAGYSSVGITDNIMAGYTFRLGPDVLFPEIGLNHIWVRQDGFTGYPNSSLGWPTTYSSMDNNQLQARASLRWMRLFDKKGIPCLSTLGVGGRYRITDDSLSLQQTVPGSAPVTVQANQERAAATAVLSLTVKTGSLDTELAYNGEYSSESILHGVWIKLRYSF